MEKKTVQVDIILLEIFLRNTRTLINYEQWTEHVCRQNIIIISIIYKITFINIVGLHPPFLLTKILIN